MYIVPTAKKSKDQDKFQFQIDGQAYEVTRFDLLPTSFVEAVSEMPEKLVTKAMRLALAGDDEELAAKLAALPIKDVSDLIRAWQKESHISLGE